MSPLRLRAFVGGAGRRLAVLLVLLGLSGAVVLHHGVPSGMAIGGSHGEHAAPACPAVLTAGGVIAVVGLVRRRRHRRAAPLPRSPLVLCGTGALVPYPTAARPRDGPKVPLFLLLGVLRR